MARTTSPRKAAPSASDDPMRQMGHEIRTLRRLRGMTMTELANKVGKTVGFLSQIERGLSRPSLITLQALGDALDVPVGWLFSNAERGGQAAGAEARYVVRRNQRRKLSYSMLASTDYLGMEDYLATPDLNRSMAIGVTTFHPGSTTGDEPEVLRFDLINFIRLGRLELSVDDEIVMLDVGDTFYLPSATPYRLRNTGAEPAEIIWIVAPLQDRL
jgi:transcriptional regulator with XRE-family HTH domain